MSKEIAKIGDQSVLIKKIIQTGDLSKLTEAELYDYNLALCELHGLNPLTQPFNYLKMKDGRVVAYANSSCTNQLRQNHGASARITKTEIIESVFLAWSETSTPDDRVTHQLGAVSIRGSAEDQANAMMKAITKSLRRGMLTHCGLSVMDETERETLQGVEIKLPVPANLDNEASIEIKKEW